MIPKRWRINKVSLLIASALTLKGLQAVWYKLGGFPKLRKWSFKSEKTCVVSLKGRESKKRKVPRENLEIC